MPEAEISYQELLDMYESTNKFHAQPDLVFSNEKSLRAVWGDEEYERLLAEGIIRFLPQEENQDAGI